MTHDMQMRNGGGRLLAVLIAAPTLAAAIGLSGIEAYRAVNPGSPLFGDPPAASLVEAIRRGNQGIEAAYAFIAEGQDPNRPILVTDPALTAGRPLMVSPLMLAVAARNRNVVGMLMSFGARLDFPQNRWAVCLAKTLGSDAIVSTLQRGNDVDAAPCPEGIATAESPLLAVLE